MELGGWEVVGLGTERETVHAFKHWMSGPPKGCNDFAWPANDQPPLSGRFFCRPGRRAYLFIMVERVEERLALTPALSPEEWERDHDHL